MPYPTPPQQLIPNETIKFLAPDRNYGLVLIQNLSPFICDVLVDGDTSEVLKPWTVDVYVGHANIREVDLVPSIPFGVTIPGNISQQASITWYSTNEPPPQGVYPIVLNSSGIAPAGVPPTPNVYLYPSFPTPLPSPQPPAPEPPISVTVNFPQPTVITSVLTIQVAMVTGSGQNFPNFPLQVGLIVLSDDNNTHPIYLGGNTGSGAPVSTGSFKLEPGRGISFPLANADLLAALGTTGDILSVWGS